MLFNIDEKQLMLELKNKDERALKICMNKYYRYVVYIVENIIGSALPYEDKEEVDSLDEECIECRKYSDYCEHILPAFWIDDDFCE